MPNMPNISSAISLLIDVQRLSKIYLKFNIIKDATRCVKRGFTSFSDFRELINCRLVDDFF